METVSLMENERMNVTKAGWNLWTSHRDEWGAYYTRNDKFDEAVLRRKDTWAALSQLTHRDFPMELSR
jgi:hypothetical protein